MEDSCADPIDPTLRFLYKPHTLTGLALLVGLFIHNAFSTNEGTGIYAVVGVFLLFALMAFRDGPFIRPHPAFWRLVLALAMLYQMMITFALFQKTKWVHDFLNNLDPVLGRKLPEKSYAEDCTLNIPNLMEKMDRFVIAHVVGWFCKAIVLRDYWICWILSIMFEFCEYSLQHQLPNFAECWWDHWVLDVLMCNWFGILLGMKTCEYFSMKTYTWRGVKQIKGYKEKVMRAVTQFTPHSFMIYEWTKDSTTYMGIVCIVFSVLCCELNAFYLKFILLIPASHNINLYRLILLFFLGIPATRESYHYFSNKNCKRIGINAWLFLVITATETLICLKFGKGMFPNEFPNSVLVFWSILVTIIVGYGFSLHFLKKH